MPWIILILSGFHEAVWATALGASQGFKRLGPSVVFVVASCGSLIGLGWVLLTIPTGTGYAVWTSIGAVSTVAYAMIRGREAVTVPKILLVAGIVLCVAGLKVVA